MPTVPLDRVPLPSLKNYTAGSVLALSACVYFAMKVVRDPKWDVTEDEKSILANNNNSTEDARSVGQFVSDLFTLMIREPICVWTMINMAFCWLILLGRAVQKLVFGELRISEQQQLRDKFWNFLFYKFIFIFGVVNVQYIDEVLLWCSWFAFLGFLHLLSQLSKDRFEYLSFSPRTPVWSHVKLMALLAAIFALSNFMLLISVFVGYYVGMDTFLFTSAEVILLSLRTLHVIVKYTFHLYDLKNEGVPANSPEDEKHVWERRAPFAYYVDLLFDMTTLLIDLLHHVHMLLWSNIFLSMASLVICMQLRYLFHEIKRKYKKHRNYLWVRSHLEQNYPMATPQELEENSDNCAICWEKMNCARKLPCTHMFHNTCLVSWLEQDTSCPTCRLALNIQNPAAANADPPEHINEIQENTQRSLNHFFHFDGSRYVSWLPSFSVEVSRSNPGLRQISEATNSQLDEMARRVQQLFPHLPLSAIIEDLRITRSVEITVENILDGRIPATVAMFRDLEVNSPTSGSLSVFHTSSEQSSHTNDWEQECSMDYVDSEDTIALGSRFSKSSSEREKILHSRKENLIKMARKRYIEKQKATVAKSERRRTVSETHVN